MDDIAIKNKVLETSLVELCDNLDPHTVLKVLRARRQITADDKQRIEIKGVTGDQVDELVNILLRKPVEAYNCFMENIKEEQSHVYQKVKTIETKIREGKI